MIAQRLFLDDLETARAVDRLLALGRVELTECQPASAGESYRPAEGARDEEALASILSGSHRSPSNKANKAGERIKALIRELQDCLNDIARFHDGFYRASKGTGQVTVVEEYLDQQFGDLLATVQKEYPALGALQGANRRVDANDLIETYDLILGDTRQTFYTEAIQGLSALIKTVFDWALGSSQLDGEAECREAWQAFSRAVGAKLDEFAVAEGWGNRTGHQRA